VVAVQLKALSKQHDQLRKRLDDALAQLSEAQQNAAAEKARANTLAQELRAKHARATPAKRKQKSTGA
jgi:septal ring factor EnvC (AmiA/AmiB activator)